MLLKVALFASLWLGRAEAAPADTRDALDRMGEVLDLRIEDGTLSRADVAPALLVSAQPRYEQSVGWYTTEVLSLLQDAFGPGSVRVCEACMAPRAQVETGRIELQSGAMTVHEIAALDGQLRGDAPPARAAIWVEEHVGGASLRIVELATGRVLFAQNFDPTLSEVVHTQRTYSLAAEVERRARRDSLTQAFVDTALFPNQHISLDWTDQWGPTNGNLSGITLTLLDPVVGLGAVHYRRLRLLNMLVGGKLALSLPTAVVRSVDPGSGGGDVLDPLVTVVGVARVPFGRSNYGGVVTVSTNGQVGIGISLLNISLLPVIP